MALNRCPSCQFIGDHRPGCPRSGRPASSRPTKAGPPRATLNDIRLAEEAARVEPGTREKARAAGGSIRQDREAHWKMLEGDEEASRRKFPYAAVIGGVILAVRLIYMLVRASGHGH